MVYDMTIKVYRQNQTVDVTDIWNSNLPAYNYFFQWCMRMHFKFQYLQLQV